MLLRAKLLDTTRNSSFPGCHFPRTKLFRGIQNRRKFYSFRRKEFHVFHGTQNARNSVPSDSAEDKKARNSIPNHFVEDKNARNSFPKHFAEEKKL
jgi:hypothetical protein